MRNLDVSSGDFSGAAWAVLELGSEVLVVEDAAVEAGEGA